MKFLELKIPPVVVFFLTVALMRAVALISDEVGANTGIRFFIVAVLLFFGGCIALAGVLEFRRAKTTVNPTKPGKASSLVCSGIYRYTRNPMYTGLFFVLVAWGCFLDNIFSLFTIFTFILYMTRFQIKPEERMLESIFGEEYQRYKELVRRWF